MSREPQRENGVVYTPAAVAQHIVNSVLDEALRSNDFRPGDPFTILDPACGEGVFLSACADWLHKWHVSFYQREQMNDVLQLVDGRWQLTVAEQRRIIEAHLFGIDLDPVAIAKCRAQLGPATNFLCGNALVDSTADLPPTLLRQCQALQRPSGFPVQFDVALGNPPYVNIRLIHQSQHPRVKDYLKAQFHTAQGNYDLYVLFCEQALRWLKPGGHLSFIVPNKIGSMDYARACRGMFHQQTTIRRITDMSHLPVFPKTGVYPYVIHCVKRKPPPRNSVDVECCLTMSDLSNRTRQQVPQQQLNSAGFLLANPLDVESRVPTKELSDLAGLQCGTTGFAAQRMADALVDQVEGPEHLPFVVSGNIDRYRIELGKVRFMKRDFTLPTLPTTAAVLSARKLKLFQQPKIAIAGMTLRLEATWVDHPLALGVQVFAVHDLACDPHFVLALLNSRLMTHLFRLRFAAKRLAGGYLAVNKGQLAQLPIRTMVGDRGKTDALHLISLARERSAVAQVQQLEELERDIDDLVYKLYGLTDPEIETVESAPTAAAA